MKKALIFCSRGLGDGLLFNILANNLALNDYQVEVYHNFLWQLNRWFPNFSIKSTNEEIDFFYKKIDLADLIILNGDSQKFNQSIKQYLLQKHLAKSIILYPSSQTGNSFLGTVGWDRKQSMVKNLETICKTVLHLQDVKPDAGLQIPSDIQVVKQKDLILLHHTSAVSKRNWPYKKFVKLEKFFIKNNYIIEYLLALHEKENEHDQNSRFYCFSDLEMLAIKLLSAKFFVGNDSGIGHLASLLKIPTFTIFTSKRKSKLWKPDWYFNEGIYPYNWIPNLKGMRIRDRLWHFFVENWRTKRKLGKLLKRGTYE